MNRKPFQTKARGLGNGLLCLLHLGLALALILYTCPTLYALTDDGATEALALRYHAEVAIAQEASTGHGVLANAMRDSLPQLLKEYFVTRDGTIALDTVDATFVREQYKLARAMEEPGVALALDVFAGDASGFEHDLQTSLTKLADHHLDVAEHAMDHAKGMDRVSDRVVDAYERQIERQLDKVEHELEKAQTAAGRFDAKFEAKLEAKLDAAAARMELKELRQESREAVKEARQEAREEAKEARQEVKAEAKAEKIEKKAEEKAEKQAEKAEKQAEKIEKKAEEKAEKQAEKAEKQAEKAADKDEKAADESDKKKK